VTIGLQYFKIQRSTLYFTSVYVGIQLHWVICWDNNKQNTAP